MKRVIFYMEPEWAFGSIHYTLCKYLYSYGFDCQLLPWNKSYTLEAMRELDAVTDLYVTTPHGWRLLGYSYRTVEPSKVVAMAHARIDYADLIHHHGYGDFDKFRRFAAVTDYLIGVSKDVGINRIPEHVPIGINFHTFYTQPSERLNTVGYAGAYTPREGVSETDKDSFLTLPKHHKRSWLVKEAAERVGLEFKTADSYHRSFVSMAGFYKSVDAVVIASTQEGAGLPAMEGGAAGKLIIGTPVGHWESRIAPYGGDTVPLAEAEFMEKTVELLSYYKNNPAKYKARCLEIQHHAQSYDWKYVIDRWINLLS